jgi:hypothetical protein
MQFLVIFGNLSSLSAFRVLGTLCNREHDRANGRVGIGGRGTRLGAAGLAQMHRATVDHQGVNATANECRSGPARVGNSVQAKGAA